MAEKGKSTQYSLKRPPHFFFAVAVSCRCLLLPHPGTDGDQPVGDGVHH